MIPHNRIRIFISSAQNDEHGFDWTKARLEIRDKLATCKYIAPFIIEGGASVLPSNQLMETEISRADIVVVLVKSTVRKGTLIEVEHVKKHKKRCLVYLCSTDKHDDSVEKLKAKIERDDYCTYVRVDFDNIAQQVYSDVMENVVSSFIGNDNRKLDAGAEEISVRQSLQPELSACSPKKSTLQFFGSSNDAIYDYLGLPFLKDNGEKSKSQLHELGVHILDWLINGADLYDKKLIDQLVEACKSIYPSVDWLRERWQAIKLFNNGNFKAALAAEKRALKSVQDAGLPSWLLNDIVIDCRNFFEVLYADDLDKRFDNEFQKQLDSADEKVYLPSADRFLCEAYGNTIREDIDISTASATTVMFGTGIKRAISSLENYLFSAVLYGSYANIATARTALARILYKYGTFANEARLKYRAMSLFLLDGSTKYLERVLESDWDDVSPTATANADKLWDLTDRVTPDRRDEVKQTLLYVLGLYMTDAKFAKAEKYLTEFAPRLSYYSSNTYLKCLAQLVRRLDQTALVGIIIPIIRERKFSVAEHLSDVLMGLRVKGVPDAMLLALCGALAERLEFIKERHGNPQFITALAKQRPDIFSSLVSLPNSGMDGLNKQWYDIKTGDGSYKDFLEQALEIAVSQHKENGKSGRYVAFGIEPFTTVKEVAEDYYTRDMEDLLEKKYFPLCCDILLGNGSLPEKDHCARSLCAVLPIYAKNKGGMPDEIRGAITVARADNVKEIPLLTSATRRTFKIRLAVLKIMVGVIDYSALFSFGLEIQNCDEKERAIFAESILGLLDSGKELSEVEVMVFMSIFDRFANDKNFAVRMTAVDFLARMTGTPYGKYAVNMLRSLALDNSPSVRDYLVHVCKRRCLAGTEIAADLLNILKNDANYTIRTFASSAD